MATRSDGRLPPWAGLALFGLMVAFLIIALYATVAFAVTGDPKDAIIWAALALGAMLGIPSYWRTWQKRTRH